MFSTKRIVAVLAVSAKAQQFPGGGAKIFSDALNGINVDDFLSNYGDVEDYSGNDAYAYADYNDALDSEEAPSYVYEEVGPEGDADYFLGDYYDNNGDGDSSDSSGRPGSSEASSNTGTKSLNTGINKTSSGGVDGYNVCRKCSGEDADACAGMGFETCNDAQDTCMVQIRSQYEDTIAGTREIVHRYYSGCSSLVVCDTARARNFVGDKKLRHECRSTAMRARFYHSSKCSLCTRLGRADDAESYLFGEDSVSMTLTVTEAGARDTSITIAGMLADPSAEIGDFFDQNNWYSLA